MIAPPMTPGTVPASRSLVNGHRGIGNLKNAHLKGQQEHCTGHAHRRGGQGESYARGEADEHELCSRHSRTITDAGGFEQLSGRYLRAKSCR
jgi:hypothetical protein